MAVEQYRNWIGWVGMWLTGVLCGACGLIAQDPPLPDPLPQIPIRSLEEAQDDPLMRAIQERVEAMKGPQAANLMHRKHPTSASSKRGAENLRWHVAERMLRTARRLEKDARLAEEDGQTELAEALTEIIARTRTDALRLLNQPHPPAP